MCLGVSHLLGKAINNTCDAFARAGVVGLCIMCPAASHTEADMLQPLPPPPTTLQGSWGNVIKYTKLPFALFYIDYALSILLTATLLALTVGSAAFPPETGSGFIHTLQHNFSWANAGYGVPTLLSRLHLPRPSTSQTHTLSSSHVSLHTRRTLYVPCSYAAAAGTLFNVANMLLVSGIELAGLSVAFPIAIGTALVMGTLITYWVQPKGNHRCHTLPMPQQNIT